jgi:hypothetical protein
MQRFVQIKPWVIMDSTYVHGEYLRQKDFFNSYMIFVGNLHGTVTDRFQRSCGSARVCFKEKDAFENAVQVEHIKITISRFTKVIQVDPHLQDKPCSRCNVQAGRVFFIATQHVSSI